MMCKWARQRQMFNPELQENLFQLVQSSLWQGPTRDYPRRAKHLVELYDFQWGPPQGTRVSHFKAQEIKPAQQSDSKGSWWSSEGKESAQNVGVGMRAQTTAPVSETLENIARTQWITMHYCLFLSLEKVIFFLKTAYNKFLKKKKKCLISLINRIKLHRHWPLRVIHICTCGLLFVFISFTLAETTESFYFSQCMDPSTRPS